MPTLVQHAVPLVVRRPTPGRATYDPPASRARSCVAEIGAAGGADVVAAPDAPDVPLRLAPNGLRRTLPDAQGGIRFVRCELGTEAALDRLPFLWDAADAAGLRAWVSALAALAGGAMQRVETRFWPVTLVAAVLLACSSWSLVRAERALGRAVRDARRRLAEEGCPDAEAAWLVRPLSAGELPAHGPQASFPGSRFQPLPA